MKASELIAILQGYLDKHGDMEVEATWEGVFRPIAVYRGHDNELLIDADGEFYRADFEHRVDQLARVVATGADKLDIVAVEYSPGSFHARLATDTSDSGGGRWSRTPEEVIEKFRLDWAWRRWQEMKP
jgi:hypothetical protein